MAGPYTTNKGKNVITDRLQTVQATYTDAPRYVAFGAGAGQAQSANVLASQIGGKAGSGPQSTNSGRSQESLVTTSVANDTYQVVATLTASGTWAITESGMFTTPVSGSGDMFAYSDFAVVNLSAQDSIQFTWKVQFT